MSTVGMNKERWDHMAGKPQWDIQVALRGPDSYYGEVLKWFTTAVIRGHMRGVIRVGGSINIDLKLVILPKHSSLHAEQIERSKWNAAHFVEHVHLAADHIGIPVMRIPGELWHRVMQYDSLSEAAREILEFVKTKNKEVPEQPTEPTQQIPTSPYGDIEKLLWKTVSAGGPSSKLKKYDEAQIAELERHYRHSLGGQ